MNRRNPEARLTRDDVPTLYALSPNEESTDLQACIRALWRGGALWVQIREKWPTDRKLVETVSGLIPHTPSGARTFINDRIDLAIGLRAHGVHLGDQDLHPDDAAMVRGGRDTIIGVSTHSVDEAIASAQLSSVDYVAIGPVFGSPTKMVREPLGLDAITRIREAIDKPIVAIGGIDRSNIANVIRAGADSAAVISALYRDGSIEDNVRELIERAGD